MCLLVFLNGGNDGSRRTPGVIRILFVFRLLQHRQLFAQSDAAVLSLVCTDEDESAMRVLGQVLMDLLLLWADTSGFSLMGGTVLFQFDEPSHGHPLSFRRFDFVLPRRGC